ncbi:paraplegin isoform X2 [Nematostella vectensis]|uniref:paraplegin isoform X2 n=1 Tax=Nematostella vectensis TaxID=45351 RepID=UPI0020779C0D|nr:paraplegin isoform X2 [Nematostella vectensis]
MMDRLLQRNFRGIAQKPWMLSIRNSFQTFHRQHIPPLSNATVSRSCLRRTPRKVNSSLLDLPGARFFGTAIIRDGAKKAQSGSFHAPSSQALFSLYLLLRNKSYSIPGLGRYFSTSSKRFQDGGDGKKPDQSSPNPEDAGPQGSMAQILPWIILAVFYFLTAGTDPTPETTWTVFYREMLSAGEVEHLEVPASQDKVYVYLHRGALVAGKEVYSYGPHYVFSIASLDSFEKKIHHAQSELRISPQEFVPIKYRTQNELFSTLVAAATSLAIIGVVWYLLAGRRVPGGGRKGGILGSNPFSGYIKAKATVVMPGSNQGGITFKDVAGMQEAKMEVMEFVDYLKSAGRYTQLGAKIPKGALLVGPPGTGKTLLAKAVATEADVPFLSMAGSDFVEMFAGVGSARVRDLFTRARKLAPCIVYIDEVDAIGRSRKSSRSMGGHNEQENTLNQLLVEMDGMNTLDGVIMLASTNRADILDNALLRPGRFDRHIAIDLPTLPERMEIFEVHLKKLTLKRSIDQYTKRLAELTPGHSGADIANICNEAALHAARLNKKNVDTKNFEYAVERVIAGMEKRTHTMSPDERRIVAYHEAGHALVGWMLEHTEPLLKVSIVPRTNASLGYAQYLPSDQKLYTTEQLFDRMCMALGGRAAEGKIFRRITTGAEDDLRKVTDMAYRQIITYGMNDRVGNISFPVKKSQEFGKKPYSDHLSHLIDEEVRLLISRAFDATDNILTKHSDKLKVLAEELIKKEVLNYDDISSLIGPCPYGDKRARIDKWDTTATPPEAVTN